MQPLGVASLAFTATADTARNAGEIRRALAAAAAAGARVLLTPECALIGYPGAAREHLLGIDWCAIADEEERLELEARRLGLVLVLGTASPWQRAPGAAPAHSNDALALNAGAQPVRYRKRSLTPGDTAHFVPGGTSGTITVDGWTLALSICFELRFGALWAEQAAAGADAFLTIAHMAGPDVDPGTKAQVIPALYAARAAEWATPLVLANTAAPDRWLDSGAWDARGVRVATQAEGLLVTTLMPRTAFAPWYGDLRREALRRSSR
jgi:predicted amidohydrolase